MRGLDPLRRGAGPDPVADVGERVGRVDLIDAACTQEEPGLTTKSGRVIVYRELIQFASEWRLTAYELSGHTRASVRV